MQYFFCVPITLFHFLFIIKNLIKIHGCNYNKFENLFLIVTDELLQNNYFFNYMVMFISINSEVLQHWVEGQRFGDW